MNSFAAHLIQLSEGEDIDDAKFQIITEYNNTNKIWIRKAFNSNGQNMSVYTKWEQIYPDYTSISLNTNGFIIFNNGLILQWWTNVGNAGTRSERVVTKLINTSFNVSLIWQHTDREALTYNRYPSVATLLSETSSKIYYITSQYPDKDHLDWGRLLLISFI